VDPRDYEKVREADTVTVTGTEDLTPGSTLTAAFHHEDGTRDTAELMHTLNPEQIAWYHAGGALYLLREQGGA
jgi:aconitate hydratase